MRRPWRGFNVRAKARQLLAGACAVLRSAARWHHLRHAPRPSSSSRAPRRLPEPLVQRPAALPPAACALTPARARSCAEGRRDSTRASPPRRDAARRRGDAAHLGVRQIDCMTRARLAPATTTTTADSAPCANSASKRLARRGLLLRRRPAFSSTACRVTSRRPRRISLPRAPPTGGRPSSTCAPRSFHSRPPRRGATALRKPSRATAPPPLVRDGPSSGRRATSAARSPSIDRPASAPPRRTSRCAAWVYLVRGTMENDRGPLGRRARAAFPRAAAPAALVGLQEHVAEVLMWQGKLEGRG